MICCGFMANGLFILLYDDESLHNCILNGIYGFLMPPVWEDIPNTRSKHYAVLADYACCEEGTEIFFFNKRTITYGGTVTVNNGDNPVFYLNGSTSPLGRLGKSELYIDMSKRYTPTDEKGVYDLGKNQRGEDRLRAIPFIIEFDNNKELTGKQVMSDELYFELGNYNYPFPSNSIQNRGFCTLTPKETSILLKLIKDSNKKLILETPLMKNTFINNEKKVLFNKKLMDESQTTNENHLEFILLANKQRLDNIIHKSLPNITKDEFIRCRQVPLCPFRPIQFDLADICLYSKNNPVKDSTIPNIIIELKHKRASYQAYNQVTKYLRWIKQIAPLEFNKVRAIIIAPDFSKNLNIDKLIEKEISLEYHDKIVLYSLDEDKVIYIN